MSSLIECVPNVSEGRRPEVIERMARAIWSAPGAILLDQTRDADHNRSVFTFVGDPTALREALRALFAVATREIDLRCHEGQHPRIGAVDVVPFVPLSGSTMNECDVLARTVASEIAEEFLVPTFLFARSASRAHCRALSDIRSGGYEGLARKLQDARWTPDFGPSAPHPSAGATAVGARPFLIAYNLQLDTADIVIARKIARAVRASSGGLPAVQAIGIFLAERACAQVSLNLLDYETTGLAQVQQAVGEEAKRLGARITSAELIGLIPQAALEGINPEALLIEDWRPERVIEVAVDTALKRQRG